MENWLPIENNPDTLNDYIKKLGFINNDYTIKELLALEDWAFDMCGSKILGALLLYPYTENHNKHKLEQEAELDSKDYKGNEKLFFMHQLVSNACGTIGLYHILSNLGNNFNDFIENNSIIDKFVKENFGKTPEEIGNKFKENKEIKENHLKNVQKGDTNVEEEVYHHFVALVPFEGRLYEFDGHKKYPIDHGIINENNYRQVYIRVIQEFMKIDPEKITFSISLLSN